MGGLVFRLFKYFTRVHPPQQDAHEYFRVGFFFRGFFLPFTCLSGGDGNRYEAFNFLMGSNNIQKRDSNGRRLKVET